MGQESVAGDSVCLAVVDHRRYAQVLIGTGSSGMAGEGG